MLNPESGFYGLSLQWLRRLLAQSPVKEQIIWLDCCHIGEWELTNFNEANSGGKGEGETKSYFFLAFAKEFEASQLDLDSQPSGITKALLESFNPDHHSEEWITNYSITDYLKQHFNTNQCTIFTNAGEAIRLIQKNIDVDSETKNNDNEQNNFCPYKGLEFFTLYDADYFYGREKLTDQLLNHIREHNFMAIVGASGSGKSSVLRAGLLYELQQGKKLSGSANWEVKVIIPTDNPFASLKLAFLDSNGDVIARAKKLSDLDELFQKGAEGFSNLITSITSQKERFILVIDQFEEIFTLCQDVALREQFLELILTAVKQSSDKFTLIIAMRADFLLKCLEKEYSGLHRLIDANQISVTPMSEDELRKAITKPAKKAKLQLDLGLVDEILKDVQQSSATLALVEDTLTELWKQRQGNSLQLITYSKLGGITGTLDKRATKFYKDLAIKPIPLNQPHSVGVNDINPSISINPPNPLVKQGNQVLGKLQQEAVRHIFLCLTQLGEGTEDTRRRVVKSSLYNKKFTSDLLEPVLQRLADERLIITDTRTSDPSKSPLESETSKIPPFLRGARGDQTPSPSGTRGDENQNQVIIDVPHEALIRNWLLLREWLTESRERLRQQRQWENLAQEWQQNPKPDYLLTGRRLRDAVEFRDKHEAEYPLNDETKNFIQQSLKQRNRNRFKSLGLFAIIPLIGTGIVGYFGFREVQIRNHLNLLRDCPKSTGKEKERDYINCAGRIEAINALNQANRLPNLNNAELNNAELNNANLNNAKLNNAELNNANLNYANLNYAELNNAELNNANLNYAELNNAKLNNAKLNNANLNYAELNYAELNYANLINAYLMDANLNYAEFIDAYLIDAYLYNAKLNYAKLDYANLNNANLNNAELNNAYLIDAKLDYANLNNAYLIDAKLDYANLNNANLNNADLTDAILIDANLTDAILTDAKNLTNEQIKSACFWDKAYYAKTWDDKKEEWIMDEEKQQAKLKELREDVASNPKKKPDCSMWE